MLSFLARQASSLFDAIVSEEEEDEEDIENVAPTGPFLFTNMATPAEGSHTASRNQRPIPILGPSIHGVTTNHAQLSARQVFRSPLEEMMPVGAVVEASDTRTWGSSLPSRSPSTNAPFPHQSFQAPAPAPATSTPMFPPFSLGQSTYLSTQGLFSDEISMISKGLGHGVDATGPMQHADEAMSITAQDLISNVDPDLTSGFAHDETLMQTDEREDW